VAWIRLSDNYINNPKITPLSDGAFRLWHEALAHCRSHQTDGLVTKHCMVNFTAYRSKRLDELMNVQPGCAKALVVKVDGFGFKLHDYLDWNPSKDEENERRTDAKERMRSARERRRSHGVAPSGSQIVTANTSSEVLVRYGTERSSSGKEDADEVGARAGLLLEELYPAWYAQHRHGARLRLVANPLQFQDAIGICQTWDDVRIEQLAAIFLTTDDDWISKTDRNFRLFASKASWCDDRLTQWERENGKVTA